jgi:NADH-quinone oxidoreductase subunit C
MTAGPAAPLVEDLARAVRTQGPDASGVLDVAPEHWRDAVTALLAAGATWFDLLTAYDDLDEGFAVLLRVVRPAAVEGTAGADSAPGAGGADAGAAAGTVLLRTRVPRERPVLASVADLYPGAAWHEREMREMYGIEFGGAGEQRPLLLHPGAPSYPLRKEVPLRARVEAPWPGAADPSGKAPRRRQLPPGVAASWVDGVDA